MLFNICSITNSDNFVFDELTTSAAHAIKNLGHEVKVSRNQIVPFATNILVGAHQDVNLPELPKNTIIWNTEQIIEGSWWMTEKYIGLLREHTVWDYSHASIKKLKEDYGVKNIHYAGLGYCDELKKVEHVLNNDIDVLFYGSISERRATILQELLDKGINLEVLFGVYGKELDEYIGRSKIVLNIHFFKECFFEPIRVGYLLNNRCFVISEESVNKEDEEILSPCIITCPYDKIVETCMHYLPRYDDRWITQGIGHDLYKSRTQESILAPLIKSLDKVKIVTL